MRHGAAIKKDYLTLNEVAAECGLPLEDLRYFGEEGIIHKNDQKVKKNRATNKKWLSEKF